MNYPLCTVIVTTYNRGDRLLPLALDSILAQTIRDYEVVLMDDASTDCTPRTIETYATKFKDAGIDFRAFRLAENSGYQCVPKNLAIYNARGDYIAYLDDDNEWMPNHLERLLATLDDNMELDLVYCWRQYVKDGHDGVPIDPHPPDWGNAAKSIMSYVNCIDTSDIVHSRGLAYHLYDTFGEIWGENERRYGDLHFLQRCIRAGARGRLVPEELTRYRWHGGNLMLTRPLGEGYAAMGIERIEPEVKKGLV